MTLDTLAANFWIDNGLAILVNQFGEGSISVESIFSWIQNQLLQPTNNKGEYYDEETKQVREYDKVKWVYSTNLFIKVSGAAPKKKIEGKDYFTRPPEFELQDSDGWPALGVSEEQLCNFAEKYGIAVSAMRLEVVYKLQNNLVPIEYRRGCVSLIKLNIELRVAEIPL